MGKFWLAALLFFRFVGCFFATRELYDNIDPLMEFKPPFIDVTTSRGEYMYVNRYGLLDRRLTRVRSGIGLQQRWYNQLKL